MTGKDPVVVLPAERFELPTNGLQKPISRDRGTYSHVSA
jgi:hypothetical protein